MGLAITTRHLEENYLEHSGSECLAKLAIEPTLFLTEDETKKTYMDSICSISE
jgi:hypothetical protein